MLFNFVITTMFYLYVKIKYVTLPTTKKQKNMKRVLFTFILLMSMGLFNFASAQDYKSMWKKIDDLVMEDKPSSIISEAEKILSKATKENNFPQMLKAQLCITEKKCDLDPELFQPEEYEKLIVSIKNDDKLSAPVKAGRLAVLHCALASAYQEMQDSYVHDFDKETREQFPAKAKEHILEALSDMETLSHIDDTEYKAMIELQEDSRLFNHDLLKVIIDYALSRNYNISAEEELDILERAIKVYEANGNRNASTILQLRVLSIRKNSRLKSIRITHDEYVKRLEALHAQTQDIEVGADVDAELADAYYIDKHKQLAFVREAQIKWAKSKKINNFKNTETEIMSKHISLYAQPNIIANKPFELDIRYTNLTNAKLTIREYAGKDKDGHLSEKGAAINIYKYNVTLDEINQAHKDKNELFYGDYSTNITLPAGHYTIVAETEGAKDLLELRITSIRIVSLSLPDKKNMLVTVLDNETGRPVPDATIMCFNNGRYDYGKKPVKSFVTDKNGEAIVPYQSEPKNRDYYLMSAVRNASNYGTPSEDCTPLISTSQSYLWSSDGETHTTKIYTDRSIYRPGQTVHVSILQFKQQKDNVIVTPEYKNIYTVYDADHKEISSTEVTTNELGSASFDVVLPTNCKLGNYSINCTSNYRSYKAFFYVEEYKRPTFDVKFDEKQNTTKYNLGENAKVLGMAKTFSDVPVQGATVKYTIEWSSNYGNWRWYQQWKELTSGETTTSDLGEINIEFPTLLPEEVYSDSISYRIKAEVTDINGEMQQGEFMINVNNPGHVKQDKKDEEVKDELTVSSEEISETQNSEVTFSAKEKDALVYYYVISNNKVETKGTKVLNGDKLNFTVKYKKEWGDGVQVHVYYVRNGHHYYESKDLVYVRPNKKLTLAWSTFRDNLQPGQTEEWVLSVKDHNNKVVNGAELLAVMYDASLDNLYPHNWELSLKFSRRLVSTSLNASSNNPSWTLSLEPGVTFLRGFYRSYDTMQTFEHQRWYKARNRDYTTGGMFQEMVYSTAAPTMKRAIEPSVGVLSEAMDMDVAMAKESKQQNEEPTEQIAKPLRTNLSELAFFYPHITTDAKGEAHIAFTLPDCLTEWKFMGLVHTKDMDYGTITTRATAKKDFMVQPNMPRFLRTGDKAVISAKIINMCDKAVKGTATIRIAEAESETVVMTKEVKFNVPAQQTVPVEFPIDSNLKDGDYTCEIVASNGTTSDGERNRLPIITTKVDIVENVPFYITDAGSTTVDLSQLFNQGSPTTTDKTISIGYTDNPALSVFKSLRALQNPKHDNAPCYAAALYSNLVLLDMSKSLGDRLENFDAEASKATADKALSQLKKLQLSSGAWTWFEGMKASYYITLSVAENLSRLQSYLNRHDTDNAPADIDKMLKKALKYLDKETYDTYKYRKSHKFLLRPSNEDIRYLSIAKNPNEEMLKKYLDEITKEFRNLTIYGRAESVPILKKYGRESAAKKFLESIKEYTVFKEGFGRYYATDLAYYSWCDYRIPTQLAAMRAMDDQQYLLDMQLWLLRQKQTQTWDNPINALDIADFLLTTNRETSLHEVTIPTLVLDGKSVLQDTIYQIPTDEKVNELHVSKTSPGISWGHVRSTFQEEVSNLKSYSSGELTIERKVMRDGNKVTIRHILHADRDMDFVQVTSQHAASLEPLRTISGYQWMGGRGCYLEVHDSYISLFFDKFTRGTTTIDMEYYIAREGEYNTGYANIECTYAPEFGGHSAGNILNYNK